MWNTETSLLNLSWGDAPRYATGLTAMALCIRFVYLADSIPLLLAYSFLIVACATDTCLSKIPNLLNLALLLAGFSYHGYASGLLGLWHAFAGAILGFALLIFPYLLGGMGAGDVKALAALGCVLGPWDIFQTFLYSGLIGGIMAALHYAFNDNIRHKCLQALNTLKAFTYTRDIRILMASGNGEQLRFPYAASFAFGLLSYNYWGGIL